ncbi:glycoside hydrolase family 127 protein [Candidatus Halobonum tyrrellensis]|uniref:Glycoside hydrolase family 127 protein n=1 Tax=Candidatus Halobonum tyrrellensis G22 TaxID=1324957 RepID=V4J3Z4_9EURY|nr:beta-L-arabinofuranosidase domain-containing protein [Candidatus Halobonum tyrrellensis]ESP90102.1 hypothetical protein K933_01037 [Candidatus Halobonum tyrrellensis G22]
MDDTAESVESVDFSDVEIDDEFWSPRIETNREVTLEYQYDQLEESGTLENFRRTRDGEEGGFQGMWFQDSDAYKWIEGASYVLAKHDDEELRSKVDEVIELVAGAQGEDGYLNTYFSLVEPDNRWSNLHMMHELYCAGHLIEAAVAHHRATGDDSLLDVATAFADHIDEVFGDEVEGVPGHEEIELALIRLYRVTDEERYLDRATYFVDLRGTDDDRLAWELTHPEDIGGSEYDDGALIPDGSDGAAKSVFLDDDGEYDGRYAQAHEPLRDQTTVEGHSVRAMYLFAAAADLALETGDDSLVEPLERLWENMTERRMYITGGIGPEHAHEGFTEDYDLRNDGYAETCAAVGSVFWNRRMFELTGEARYPDLVERTLYNGFLAGVSADGTKFFYENPLESDGDHHRKGWFTCACCPPNAARLLASLGDYLYARDDDGVYVNQYVGSTVTTSVGGAEVTLSQESSLPWEGAVELTVDASDEVAVRLRVPEWADGVDVRVNGDAVDEDAADEGSGYVELRREWDGDAVTLSLDQSVEAMVAHPNVGSDAGRVALTRGPLVYCAEDADNDRPVHQYTVDADADFGTDRADLTDAVGTDVVTLGGPADVPSLDGWEGELYRPVAETDTEETTLTAVPYFAWDNREPGAMRVWFHADR